MNPICLEINPGLIMNSVCLVDGWKWIGGVDGSGVGKQQALSPPFLLSLSLKNTNSLLIITLTSIYLPGCPLITTPSTRPSTYKFA